MPFLPGQSGNPGGRKKNRPWRDAIERAITRRNIDGMEGIDALADALLDVATGKDISALKEIGDRIDGKVPQAHIGSDDPDDPPIAIGLVELRPVDPK